MLGRRVFCVDLHVPQRLQKKAVDEEVLELPFEQFGRPKAPAGTWGSCIRIVDPIEVSCLTFRGHIPGINDISRMY